MPSKFDTYLAIRLTGKVRTSFHRKAIKYGKPSDVLREIIEAFIDDRLTIQPDEKKESLYATRIQN